MSNEAVMRMEDGVPVVLECDEVVHVSPAVWEVMDDGSHVLTLGTAGRGMGVVRYWDTQTFSPEGYRILNRMED